MIYKALLLIPAVLQSCVSAQELIVRTSKGQVEGIVVDNTDINGTSFRAFMGMRYATIETRFQHAVPVKEWPDVQSAKKDGPACPQLNKLMEEWEEQCLYINVYTPLDTVQGSNLPVMVFIHGGGFTLFSSYSRLFGPDYIVPKRVILVTFNYRLGFAGFLTLGTKEAPGNMGLHDTRLALQWVQQEISYFGGDKDKVTLFGQSGGASITLFHYISPESVGLFKRAIAQSGPITADWSSYTKEEGIKRAKLLAKAVNCNVTTSIDAILSCLQRADIKKLVQFSFTPSIQDDTDIPGAGIPFMPAQDDRNWSENPFFTDSLENLATQANSRKVPLVTGITSDEGVYFIASGGGEGAEETAVAWNRPGEREPWRQAKDKAELFLPKCVREKLKYASSTKISTEPKKCSSMGCIDKVKMEDAETLEEYADVVRSTYFENTKDEKKIIKSTIRLYSDNRFNFPFMTVARFLRKNTYAYLFSYDGSWKIPNKYFEDKKIKGVQHGDDLSYLFFGTSPKQMTDSKNANNVKVKNFMVEMWTKFAISGELKTDRITNWSTVEQGTYLHIDKRFSVKSFENLNRDYYNFWAKLIAQSGANCPLLNNVN